MSVKLRLKRLGRRHQNVYRLSAMDARRPRDGRVLEELGLYLPEAKDPKEQAKLNEERIKYWLSVGAVPSPTAAQLFKKHGIVAR